MVSMMMKSDPARPWLRGLARKLMFSLLVLLTVPVLLDAGLGIIMRSNWFNALTLPHQDLMHCLRAGSQVSMRVGGMTPDEWTADAPIITIAVNN